MKFTEFPRRRPVTHRPESNLELFGRSRRSSPVGQSINTSKFNSNPNVAIVGPSQNIHEPPNINQNPFYLCQPEVRKARREILLKKRPASPRQTIAATVRSTGHGLLTNEDEENRSYNERSRIIKSPVNRQVHVTIENFDEINAKPMIHNKNHVKYGRRASSQVGDANANNQSKRRLSKTISGNYEFASKERSSFSSSMDDKFDDTSKKLVNSPNLESPSFVILQDPIKQNKWMKPSWYL